MKASTRVRVAIILALIGTAVAAYSYTQLQQQDVLFNENSIQLEGENYRTWEANVIIGNYFYISSPRIVGSVSTNGTGVDFYLVDVSNWTAWQTDIGQRSALSIVHLNVDALSSQSTQKQFSSANLGEDAWIVILVNDEYPQVNSASVNVTIAFRYNSLFSAWAFIAGLAMLGIAIVRLIVITRRKAHYY